MKSIRLVWMSLEQASKALTEAEQWTEYRCEILSSFPAYNLRSAGDVVKGLGKVNLNGVSLKPAEPSVLAKITTIGDTMEDAEKFMSEFLKDIGYTEKTVK